MLNESRLHCDMQKEGCHVKENKEQNTVQNIKGDYTSPLSSFWVFTARYWNDPRLGECCFLSHYVICFVGRNNLLQRSNMK